MDENVKRWRFGNGTIRLTVEEAQWLLEQEGSPAVTWPVKDNWAGPGFTARNDESTS